MTTSHDLQLAVTQLSQSGSRLLKLPDPSAIGKLSAIFDDLLPEVGALYGSMNGTWDEIGTEFTIMSVDEIVDLYRSFEDELAGDLIGNFGDPTKATLLLSDTSGNYAGVFIEQPLRGRGFVYDHDEPIFAPLYKNLGTMLTAFLQGARKDNGELIGNYPAVDDGTHDYTDGSLSDEFLRGFDREPTNVLLLVNAVRLSAPRETGKFLRYLQHQDPYVRAAICELIGLRRFLPGLSPMVAVAKQGHNNPTIATLVALRDWDAPEARAAWNELQLALSPDYQGYFKRP